MYCKFEWNSFNTSPNIFGSTLLRETIDIYVQSWGRTQHFASEERIPINTIKDHKLNYSQNMSFN